MPQVVNDPTFRPGVIVNGGTDLFAYPNVAQPSILGLQAPATQPLPPGTSSATGLIVPDLQISQQLKNFPSDVYNTSPTSLLTHFMAALLGAPGAGQLRMRQLVARLQQAMTSTRFYDLDRFYGALFGAQRGPDGTLPVNPNTGLPVNPYGDLASPDAWDEIEAIDAIYRERIIALAKAIALGGTAPGLRAIGEAITGAPCDVYEVFRLLDNAEGPAPGYQTWAQVMAAYPAWSSFTGQTWQAVEGVITYAGLLANGAPNEVVIRPRKTYPPTPAGAAQQSADMFSVLSVAEVLKPASAIVSVDTTGPGIVLPAQISAAWADSEYWEIVHLVTPSSPPPLGYGAIINSYQGSNSGWLAQGTYVTPSPPMTRSLGARYSYAADVTTITASADAGSDPNAPQVTDGQDFQTVLFPGGQALQYLPAQAVMSPKQAATARAASAVAVKSAPYSGPRVPVVRAS